MAQFVYDDNIPAAILPELKRNLEPWRWIIPSWCERVFISYSTDSDEEDGSARCLVEYSYRWARVTFFPCFLIQNDTLEVALHEILHIPLAIIADWVKEKIKILVSGDDDPILRQSLLDDLKERVESATEDLAIRISDRMKINDE